MWTVMRTRNRSIVVSKEQLIEREARVKERKERKHCVSPPVRFYVQYFWFCWCASSLGSFTEDLCDKKKKKYYTVFLPLRQPTIKRDCLRDDLDIFWHINIMARFGQNKNRRNQARLLFISKSYNQKIYYLLMQSF